jgi:hypothetical protein
LWISERAQVRTTSDCLPRRTGFSSSNGTGAIGFHVRPPATSLMEV